MTLSPPAVLLTPHRFPAQTARSLDFQVTANGVPLDVISHSAAHFTSLECDGPVSIALTRLHGADGARAPRSIVVRPSRHGIQPRVETTPSGTRATFAIAGPVCLQVEMDGAPLLYIYALPPAAESPRGPHVRRFESGRVHDVGMLTLGTGEVCWLEPGAIVRGSIRAADARDVLIGGYGVLDGSLWPERGEPLKKAIILERCSNCRVENILMVSPCRWMVVLADSEDMQVRGVRQVADTVSSDGIDIVGSRRVRISGCMLHNGDDNIAIKALNDNPGQSGERWCGNVEAIVVSDCSFYNIHGGSAMEIGYETCTEHIRNIRFEDIDVLAVHQFGSVFGIHTGDRAQVHGITWERIRVEHHYDKLIDMRVVWSRWNRDAQRGSVRLVVFRDISVVQIPPNVGYTLSVIAGYDAEHTISDVLFENFVLGGRRVANADHLDLVTRHAHNLVFR
ncbi:hypothetical protein DB346_20260 [Verrucomicrobia bacterium LW23]|nr:hypothetical protein DB346_20260 [Verrucomicrobia bacterium LW23]